MPKRRANGEGSIYKRKDGTWCAQYTDINGKVRYLYGKKQTDVKEKLKEAIRQFDDGVVVESKKMSFSEWVEEWLLVYKKSLLKETTFIKLYQRYATHIKPYFCNIQLKDIRQDMLQRFLNEKMENRLDGKPGGYSTGVCKDFKDIFYGSLKKACELGYISRNPADGLRTLTVTYKEKRIFTVDEQRRFEKQVMREKEHMFNVSIYLIMLHTGLRCGEALGLQIGDIDFDKGEINVQRTVNAVPAIEGGGMHFYSRTPKTKAGRRTIPLSPQVAELLKAHLEARNKFIDIWREQWISGNVDLKYVNDGYLFITERGNVIFSSNLGVQLKRMCNRIGIPPITPHGLRHTFATRWIEAGLDVRSLAEILGHADIKMTLNTYTHATQEQKKKNMDAMGTLFGNNL